MISRLRTCSGRKSGRSAIGIWETGGGRRVGSEEGEGNLSDGYTIDEMGAPFLEDDAEAMTESEEEGGDGVLVCCC